MTILKRALFGILKIAFFGSLKIGLFTYALFLSNTAFPHNGDEGDGYTARYGTSASSMDNPRIK